MVPFLPPLTMSSDERLRGFLLKFTKVEIPSKMVFKILKMPFSKTSSESSFSFDMDLEVLNWKFLRRWYFLPPEKRTFTEHLPDLGVPMKVQNRESEWLTNDSLVEESVALREPGERRVLGQKAGDGPVAAGELVEVLAGVGPRVHRLQQHWRCKWANEGSVLEPIGGCVVWV